MEKEFFDVFPSLKLKDQLKEWLEMVTVSKVTCNHAKTRLWVYIQSERWIHKKFIFALEDQIERQCFPGIEMQVTVIERFHLSKQYSPANFLEVYRASMELELKNYNMLEYKFDTQLLIEGEGLDEDAIHDYIMANIPGDCLLAIGDENLIKIHFHTNTPWKVLEYCASLGEIHDIVVENMELQAEGRRG